MNSNGQITPASTNYQVYRINAFDDNYLWALVNNGKCAIVDPGDAAPVRQFLDKNQFELTDILVTHHHNDHVGGIAQLAESFPHVKIFGPNTKRFAMVTEPCEQSDRVTLNNGIELNVLELHGHTIDHIGYYDKHSAFVGDTLFSVGCGRLFEGSPQQMFDAHNKLVALGEDINIYCAHEYTLANIEFALSAEPDNAELHQYKREVERLRATDKASIPTTIKQQLAVNPFLRLAQTSIHQQVIAQFDLSQSSLTPLECFTYLRKWKDKF